MWFRLPEGTTGISVENQEFSAEVVGKDGRGYFRAPDHFAPRILDMAGFAQVGAPDNTDLPDLPQADPERDSAITRMIAQTQALEAERDILRAENADLAKRLEDRTQELESLKAQIVESKSEEESSKSKK